MKRTVLLFALMTTLLLPGCAGKRDRTQFDRWQQRLGAAEEISFTARITGTWEDGAASFTARVERAGETTELRVTAPETIAGIVIRRAASGDALEYGGLTLVLTGRREGALSPCGAGDVLLDALTQGRLLYTGREGDLLTAALSAPGGETVTVWRTQEDVPVRAEIARGERAELILTLEDWETRDNGE